MATKKSIIKKDLIEQLKIRGVTGKAYFDLIEDYISLWQIKNNLIEDIKQRGVTIQYQNGENQYGYKKNDSINELNKTSTQMLKILNELGLKANTQIEDDDDEM